jgi:mRNA interferase HigB
LGTRDRFDNSPKGRKDQPAVKTALDAWFAEASHAHWVGSADVKRLYASASIVGSDRVVFSIKGNDYRLVVAIDYEKSIAWMKWIGTHAEYDTIDVRKVRYGD